MLDDELLEPFTTKKEIHSHTIFLDEDIVGASYYRKVCMLLSESTKEDEFVFVFNTDGGNIDGMLSLLSAIKSSESMIHGKLVGSAASAGSVLFLSCDSYEVMPMSTMMVHTMSYVACGSQPDIKRVADFNEKWTKSLIGEIYQDFLTDEEFDNVNNGHDIYFDSDEIIKKLLSMSKKRAARELLLEDSDNITKH